VDVVGRVFEPWQRPPAPRITLSSPRPATDRRRVVLPMMNKSQADVAYGFTTVTRGDPDYYAYWLMNHVMGQYALGGRLGDSIRERQGMAYYVSSTLDANVIEGPLMIRAGVSPANVDRTIQSIDEELTRARREGLTQKELSESKQFLIGSLPRSLETNVGIAGFLQSTEFFGLGLDYDRRLPDLLGAVGLDAVNDAAIRALDPARATIVVAGPYGA
jgi:zinc protease